MQRHGCNNLTNQLDTTSFDSYAVARGGFGDVFRGKLESGDQIAAKTVRLYTDGSRGRSHLKSTAPEMYAWSKCVRPNVVAFLGLAEFRGQIAMISPWTENGTLTVFLCRNPGIDRLESCKGICEGLAYLHSLKIVHRDLKGVCYLGPIYNPTNHTLVTRPTGVLISTDGAPMLTDFGGSKLLECSIDFSGPSGSTCSIRWAAPEILDPDMNSTNYYAADVYTLGMADWQTLTGKLPYHELQPDVKVIMGVSRRQLPKRPDDTIPQRSDDGDALWCLLERCWNHEPEGRPSAEEVTENMSHITRDRPEEWEKGPERETD